MDERIPVCGVYSEPASIIAEGWVSPGRSGGTMGLVIAAGSLSLVVILLVIAAFRTWNDPKNDLHD
jgi:hypothetical protein